jgi:hypothetical protein
MANFIGQMNTCGQRSVWLEKDMEFNIVDVTMHIDENITHNDLEDLRDQLLMQPGVIAASFHDQKPHLIMIEYNPDVTSSSAFINVAKQRHIHAELIGL